MTDQPNAPAVDKSWTVPCPEYRCGAPAGEACLRLDGTRSTVSHARRWRAYDRAQQAHANAPAPMTPVPDYIAGARALLAATRSADLLAEVERHILLLADQPDSALGDVPPSRRRGHLDAAAVVGRYRALIADPAVAAPATADDGLRERLAAAMWQSAEHNIIAEWICCDPINPGHDLCAQGAMAMQMIRALIIDDPEAYKPAPLPGVVLAVRDDRLAGLRRTVDSQAADLKRLAGEREADRA